MSNNIWFSSDFHYHHKNIVRGTSEWQDKGSQRVRDFDTLEEHDNKLVENINASIKENDTMYFLGDWSFGGIEQIWNLRKQIKCRTIHLIYGNHDHHIENGRVLPNVRIKESIIRKVADGTLGVDYDKGESILDKYSLHDIVEDAVSGVGKGVRPALIFKSLNHYKEITIAKQRIILCHFAFRVWNKSHHGSWNLYGHSHGTLPDYTTVVRTKEAKDGFPGTQVYSQTVHKCMDVGMDTHPEFRPYHFDEIKEIMDKRVILKVDHHNENTN